MKNPILITKEQERINDLSHEAMQILEILDQIENHTAALRKKLVSEFSVKSENVSLKLDNI
jgi:hypothetical protein